MELPSPPPNIQKHFPPTTLSVHQFLTINLPPCATITTQLMRTQKYYSNLLPTSDNVTVDEIISLLSPPDDILANLRHSVLQTRTQSDVIKSIQCPHSMTAGGQRYPLWLVSFWVQLSSVRQIQKNWKTAVQNLETQMARNQDDLLLLKAFNSLAYVPWTGYLEGFQVHSTIKLDQLSVYFTRDWLTDDHILVMLDTLKEDLVTTGGDNYFIENTAFMTLLSGAYHNKDKYQTEHLYGWMRKRGEDLAGGQKRYLATVANRDNVHWVALVVDFVTQELLYGDSFGHPISESMLAVINWWTHYHTNSCFTVSTLPISRQQDGFSCGMLAWDALRHHLGHGAHVLMDPRQPFHDRMEMFLRLTLPHHKDSNVKDLGEDLDAKTKEVTDIDNMATNDLDNMSNEDSGSKSVLTHQDMSPPHSVKVKSLKRSSSNEIGTSSTSTTKRSCTKSLSSIRTALQDDEKNQQ